MSEKYKFHDQHGIHFVTTTVVHWIDLFTRKELRHVVLDSLRYCQKEKGLVIHSWCLMPSHLHMIVSSSKENLSDIMRDFKKHTSKKIIEELGQFNESRKEWLFRAFQQAGSDLKRITSFKVWQDGNQPKGIETNSFLEEKLNYIHNNPVESEVVDEAENYLYSSARDYAGIKGLLEVEVIA